MGGSIRERFLEFPAAALPDSGSKDIISANKALLFVIWLQI